ncbi:MAG: hypothetical protein JWO53_1193 [Chlamydiia bacterium]|nr:hypothetical protein [Chlamydiia bacterium]
MHPINFAYGNFSVDLETTSSPSSSSSSSSNSSSSSSSSSGHQGTKRARKEESTQIASLSQTILQEPQSSSSSSSSSSIFSSKRVKLQPSQEVNGKQEKEVNAVESDDSLDIMKAVAEQLQPDLCSMILREVKRQQYATLLDEVAESIKNCIKNECRFLFFAAPGLDQIEELNLDGAYFSAGSSLAIINFVSFFNNQLPNLRSLSMENCKQIKSDAFAFSNLLTLTNIKLLNISNSDWLIDNTVSLCMHDPIPSKIKQITSKNCPNLSQEVKDKLIAAYPTITFIF